MDVSSVLGPAQTFVPLLGGFGVLIWLVWRLFWKVDRRSQMELSSKDKEIAFLTLDRDKERTLRFAAEERAVKAESRESALEARLQDLTDQISELRAEVGRLRSQLNQQNGQSPS